MSKHLQHKIILALRELSQRSIQQGYSISPANRNFIAGIYDDLAPISQKYARLVIKSLELDLPQMMITKQLRSKKEFLHQLKSMPIGLANESIEIWIQVLGISIIEPPVEINTIKKNKSQAEIQSKNKKIAKNVPLFIGLVLIVFIFFQIANSQKSKTNTYSKIQNPKNDTLVKKQVPQAINSPLIQTPKPTIINTPLATSLPDKPVYSADEVLKAYYEACNERDIEQAYNFYSQNYQSEHSQEQFKQKYFSNLKEIQPLQINLLSEDQLQARVALKINVISNSPSPDQIWEGEFVLINQAGNWKLDHSNLKPDHSDPAQIIQQQYEALAVGNYAKAFACWKKIPGISASKFEEGYMKAKDDPSSFKVDQFVVESQTETEAIISFNLESKEKASGQTNYYHPTYSLEMTGQGWRISQTH